MQMSFPLSDRLGSIRFLIFLLSCATCAAAAQPLPAQTSSEQERLAGWIERLASRKFNEREQAMKELEVLGPGVLPSLRKALKSATETETQRRLQLLISRLAEKELSARLLTASRVRLDLQDVRLDEAVAELAKQCGGPIDDGEWFDGRARFVTLSTGDTDFWDAFQRLCEKAGFVENEALMGPFRLERGLPEISQRLAIMAAAPGIHLKPGKPNTLPTCVAGSVRIRWLGAAPTRDGAVDLRLEVSGEPRLQGLACGEGLDIITALDSQGQKRQVTLAPPNSEKHSDLISAKLLGHRGGGWIVMFQNGTIIKGNCFGTAPEVPAGPFIVTLRMGAADKTARRLRELTAKLTLATTVHAATPLVVDKLFSAAGQSVQAVDGTTIKVERVEQASAQGDIQVDVAWSRPYGPGPFGTRSGIGGHMEWKNGIIKMGGVDRDKSPAPLEGAPRLLDANGKAIVLAAWNSPGWTVTRAEMTQRVTLVYRRSPGQGNPAQLVFPGQRTVLFEVPLIFKDVAVPY